MVERLAIYLAVEVITKQGHPAEFTGNDCRNTIVRTCRTAGLSDRWRRTTVLRDVVALCYKLNPGYRPIGTVRRALGWSSSMSKLDDGTRARHVA